MEVLAEEMNYLRWNILGISEMCGKGIGESTTEEGRTIFFSHELYYGEHTNQRQNHGNQSCWRAFEDDSSASLCSYKRL